VSGVILKTIESSRKKTEVPPRQRILDAAMDLFYSRGIRAVSVDEIAAAANTNKMTLYRHFESKDQLVAEYLRSMTALAMARDEEVIRPYTGDAYAQLRALAAHTGQELCKRDSRGCPMSNAAVEFPDKDHPARVVIDECKSRYREGLVKLCREAGYAEPERLAEQLFLLFEGACVNIQSMGRCGPGARFTDMAYALMDSHQRTVERTA
jgi:AcrR family transcriptional regulator